MFERNNLTDFEKLLFANKRIKELKEEIRELNIEKGILKSDIDDLVYKLQNEILHNETVKQHKKQ